MFTLLLIISLSINGVFGDEVKSVSVMGGDSLTLHTDLTEIQTNDVIDWRFGEKEDLIAQINKVASIISLYADVLGGRFRDRLKLNNHTGDLTITNINIEDSGDYQLQIISRVTTTRKTFSVSVIDVVTDEIKSVSVKDGDSVTLHTDVPDIKKYDVILFQHENSLLAELNRKTAFFSTYDDVHDGRFKGRLQLNVQTGSLTITNIRIKHAGLYQVDLSRTSSSYTKHQSFTVNVSGKVTTVSVIMGESVTLKTNTEIQTYDLIQWTFASDDDTRIAEIYKPDYLYNIYDNVLDGRFRDRLNLKNQTGDLTITNIKIEDAGLYELKMSNRRQSIQRRFSVHVSVFSSYVIAGLCVAMLVIVALTAAGGFYYRHRFPKATIHRIMVGHSVRLQTDVENIKTNDMIEWRFKPGLFQKTLIAKIKKNKVTGGDDESFNRNVQLNSQTGSLYITNITTNQFGLYEVKITIDGKTSYKRFRVIISDFNLIKYLTPTIMSWKWKRPASQDEHSSVL